MNNNFMYKLLAFIFSSTIVVGIPVEPLLAQSKRKPASHVQSTSNAKMIDKATTSSDSLFVDKISRMNLAQIELGELALQKAFSEEVKEYARVMIEHHTMFQTALADIIIKHPSSAGINAVNDANEAPAITTTNNDADKLSTLGGTGGTTGNATAEGMTNGEYNSNLPKKESSDRVVSGPSARENAKEAGRPDMMFSKPTTSGTGSPSVGNHTAYKLPAEPSEADKNLLDELAVLSGAQFEERYIQEMMKMHSNAISIFEEHAINTEAKDDQLVNFSSKNLSLVKKHYEMARELGSPTRR